MKHPTPSLATLRTIRATAQLGSFSAAADQLGITQGAVAQKVRQFEEQIGFLLFDRWARGLRPTLACLKFINEFEPALDQINLATSNLAQSEATPTNQVIVSTTPSIASRWLIPRLSEFYLDHADIVIAIDATEKLRRFSGPDAIDIALRWGGTSSADHESQPILSDTLIGVATPQKLANREPSLQLIEEVPLINDGHQFWKKWSAYFNLQLKVKPLEFGQTNHAIDAAINGLGLALVPKMLVQDALNSGKLVRALPEKYDLKSQIQFHLITKRKPQRPEIERVVEWLKKQAGLDQSVFE